MEQSISTQSMALLEGSSILRNLAIGGLITGDA